MQNFERETSAQSAARLLGVPPQSGNLGGKNEESEAVPLTCNVSQVGASPLLSQSAAQTSARSQSGQFIVMQQGCWGSCLKVATLAAKMKSWRR